MQIGDYVKFVYNRDLEEYEIGQIINIRPFSNIYSNIHGGLENIYIKMLTNRWKATQNGFDPNNICRFDKLCELLTNEQAMIYLLEN